jgi:hypothetical protein
VLSGVAGMVISLAGMLFHHDSVIAVLVCMGLLFVSNTVFLTIRLLKGGP